MMVTFAVGRLARLLAHDAQDDFMNKPASLPTQKLTQAELENLSAGGEVLEADSFGPKVYKLANGLMLKIFRQRRFFSSATLIPYSRRFIKNAQRLQEYGIPTIHPLQHFRLPEKRTTAVVYSPLPGITIAQLVLAKKITEDTIREIARFIKELHGKGIYFRSLHIGNIIQTPDNQLGLIDIADMHFQRRALSRALSKRNFQHFKRQLDQFCKYNKCDFPWQSLLKAYEEAKA